MLWMIPQLYRDPMCRDVLYMSTAGYAVGSCAAKRSCQNAFAEMCCQIILQSCTAKTCCKHVLQSCSTEWSGLEMLSHIHVQSRCA